MTITAKAVLQKITAAGYKVEVEPSPEGVEITASRRGESHVAHADPDDDEEMMQALYSLADASGVDWERCGAGCYSEGQGIVAVLPIVNQDAQGKDVPPK